MSLNPNKDDGLIHVTCEYCSTVYEVDPDDLAPGAGA